MDDRKCHTHGFGHVSTHMNYLLARARPPDPQRSGRAIWCRRPWFGVGRFASNARNPLNMQAWLHVVMRRQWFNTVRQRRAQVRAHIEFAPDVVDSSLVDTRASFDQFERAWKTIAGECTIHRRSSVSFTKSLTRRCRIGSAWRGLRSRHRFTERGLHLKGRLFGS